jgi:hypothetical protein
MQCRERGPEVGAVQDGERGPEARTVRTDNRGPEVDAVRLSEAHPHTLMSHGKLLLRQCSIWQQDQSQKEEIRLSVRQPKS